MAFRIADTFSDSLVKLTGQEQKAVKTAAFDLQLNPDHPGLSMHRVDRARDKFFWTARVNRDIRLVVHKKDGDTLLAWVGHHDDAYRWAETRRIDTHPKTGAAQIVEIRETVEEIIVPKYVEEEVQLPRIFAEEPDDVLLSWGVPEDWLETVRELTEETVLDVAARLPMEAGEALVQAATGTRPKALEFASDPFAHPDASRRFKVLETETELAAALDAPWEKWTTFLHPAQREFVERDFSGPARVVGSAGTGKTIVALHRAVRLAKEKSTARVLLTTFNQRLVANLQSKIDLLGDAATRGRISVSTLYDVGLEEAKRNGISFDLVGDAELHAIIGQCLDKTQSSLSKEFVSEEWALIIDAWGILDFETYLNLPRLGRRVRLAASKREEAWGVFECIRSKLEAAEKMTKPQLMHTLSRAIPRGADKPFDHVIVDEAQDLSVDELTLLAALGGTSPNGLFFAGDIGQRIFRPPFPWKATGVEIQGRSRTLRLNYRTTEQIRRSSDLLLPTSITEGDGNEERRDGVVSLFEGQAPDIQIFEGAEVEERAVTSWIANLINGGFAGKEIACLARSHHVLERCKKVRLLVGEGGQEIECLDMHDAKGLEFRAVAILGCDDGVIPDEERLLLAKDEAALDEIMATERHLLYVAFSRARERVWLSSSGTPSEFVLDLLNPWISRVDKARLPKAGL